MESKLKYDEFYYSVENKVLLFNKLNKSNYLSYEDNMFCPDCHQAKLSYVFNAKTPHLRQKSSTPHKNHCPYQHKSASSVSIKKHFDTLNDTQIQHKLDSMMRYLCTDKNTRQTYLLDDTMQHNPMLIENQTKNTKTYSMLKRKSLRVYFTNEDKNEIYIFYGKAKLQLEHKENYAFLKIIIANKIISIYRSKSFIPNDIDENAQYYIVCIGYLEDTLFKIKLLKPHCLKYEKIEHREQDGL